MPSRRRISTDRLFGTLGLEVNLEFLLGAEIPPLFLLTGRR
jgi:hypothetical protein